MMLVVILVGIPKLNNLVKSKGVFMKGEAWYQGEKVRIIEVSQSYADGKTSYMIHWGGPIWVDEGDLQGVVWLVG